MGNILAVYNVSSSAYYATLIDAAGLLSQDIPASSLDGVVNFLRNVPDTPVAAQHLVPVVSTAGCSCGMDILARCFSWKITEIALSSPSRSARLLHLICSQGLHRVPWEQLLPEAYMIRHIGGSWWGLDANNDSREHLAFSSYTVDISRRLRGVARGCDEFRSHTMRMPTPPASVIHTAATANVPHGPLFLNMMHGERMHEANVMPHR